MWPKYWSFSFSISPSNEYSGLISFRMDWLDSLQSKWLSRVFSNTIVQKRQFFGAQVFFMVQLSHSYLTTGKTIALTICTFVSKVMCLLFNILSRLVIAFLPRSNCLLISWQPFHGCSNSWLNLEPKKIVCYYFHCFPIYLPWSSGTRCHVFFVFLTLSFKPAFSLSSLTFIKRLFSSSSLSAIRVLSSAYLSLLIFLLIILIPILVSSGY